ncbi:hypothetical protein HOLleu_03009 [Holothuria leucospilota]|uniref:Uncharacterized protein n=1 Tax=Holothuria leucospilota TaxID=206669 RepID=A0A9Q1CSC6_HOLLE|nr:hypothetical protein HOLleu_03009 [Holothuria leucospilota]
MLSKYLFNKQFSLFQNHVQKHYYCYNCFTYIGLDFNTLDECPGCNSLLNLDEIEKNFSFFLYTPIEHQLRNLLQKKGIAELSRSTNDNENLQDIHQGLKYKELFQDLSEFDLSITLNCDGVPLYKSSQTSFWPIQFIINELPKDQRAKNVILCGVWVGNSKPRIDLFFKPFVDELKKLGNEGFQWQDETGLHTSRVYCAVVSCDAVARCLLQNFHQFNGSFGCGTCLHEGEMVQRGDGFTRVYPVRGVNEKRTARGTVDKANEAMRINNVFKGVKGPSIFSLIPRFNIIDGFVPDFMHSVILGVVRQFSKLWFNSQNHLQPFYIGRSVANVSKLLEGIKPPSNMVRLPRSLSERKFWKATEWRNFLFFSPLLLMNILPDTYLRHWWLLVYAIFNLSSENLSVAIINKSKAALLKFVIKVESLYGTEHVSYNVHQLTHLAQYALNWGPLWATSAFPFESNNQVLKRFCHGTKGIGNQIMKNSLIWSHLHTISEDSLLMAGDNVKEFYEHLSQHGGKLIKNAVSSPCHCTALGHPIVRDLTDLEKAALVTVVPNCHLHNKVSSFNRFMLRKTLIHSKGYSDNIKQNDSIIALTNGIYVSVVSLFLIKQGTLTTPVILGTELKECNFFIRDRDVSANLAECFHKVIFSTLVAFSPDLFKCKCLLMTHRGSHFVIEWPDNDLVR